MCYIARTARSLATHSQLITSGLLYQVLCTGYSSVPRVRVPPITSNPCRLGIKGRSIVVSGRAPQHVSA
ncbi:hypothetical protein J6590_013203 [Homalodisca vitripennis]|nr:hypothetical protein J6590_013203 [Homalodisca vitripennis]